MPTDSMQQFHFLDPWWLLALIPAALLLWLLSQSRSINHTAWSRVVDNSLLPYLLVKDGESSRIRLPLTLLAGAWIVSVLALANPTWQRLPQPVYEQPEAQIIVLDLSPTMLAQDVTPSRLIQARYKVEDILRRSEGKQTGLVVYSGDAFTVTPLTDDIATLKSQLHVLEPSLMPAMGNRPDLGLQKAGELLKQAGFPHGHILLLADEAGQNDTVTISKNLAKQGYQVSVLAIGTAAGAPIPGIRDQENKPIMSRVDNQALQQIATAGKGQFAAFTANQQDVKSILAVNNGANSDRILKRNVNKKEASRWKQIGPYLAILVLPLLLLAFRRGWLLSLSLVILVQFSIPQPAIASGWDDLWQRPDQQAAAALQGGKFNEAARIAPNVAQRGAAEYREGDYQQAIESFSQQKSAQGAYNLGNALAKAGDYEKSLAAYDNALKQQPKMENASFNRKLVADLLKKQQEQQKKQDQQQAGQEGDHQKQEGQQKAEQERDHQKQEGQQQAEQKGDQQKQEDQQQAEQKGDQQKQEGQQQAGQEGDHQKQEGQQQAEQEGDQQNQQFSQAGSKDEQKQAQQRFSEATKAAQDSLKPDEKEANSPQATAAKDDKLTPEQRQSVENWLRRVPDDPGGLLRRKFLYQYQQRQQAR